MTDENRQFPKRFDYAEAEPRLYARWKDADAFSTAYAQDGSLVDASKKDAQPYVIVIPPPNITGRLHMGHALNNTIQDALIRFKRMDGFDALWVPGTDHAGIATQTVVKKQLDAEGIDYRELGREKMIERIWSWRNQYGHAIIDQLERIGCSCDWSRTRFTMDEGLNEAVRHAFVKLYEEGLLYRGKRIVNWCPVDRTALSDDEVDKADEKGKMYHIRYPFEDDAEGGLVVATTRPETLFGDVAVAVHPEHPTLAVHIGRKLVLPLQGRIIPVIGDEHADPEKGTGCVKITPAHDPNDFEVGLRHDLEQINVMNEDASMNDVVPEKYRGLDRYKARKLALEDLDEQGLLVKVEDHTLAIGRSYRSKVPIEFRLSDQWFVKMEPLAKQALEASGYVKTDDGWARTNETQLDLHPERNEKTYLHWLSNIRDWCISRQIWWGHRVPAWHHVESGEILVAMEEPEVVKANPDQWRQDEDVLDTWFSSWLWPMSTLGWPARTPDFERYYPTSVLSTAKDILFFWVARMNFAGLHFENRMPYRDVYLHSVLADETGAKMSKSLGNGIDPVSVIDGATTEALKEPILSARPADMKQRIKRLEKNFPDGFEAVGADALRWTLVYSVNEGEHVRLSLTRFTEGRNFITKLWNGAGRVITALRAEMGRSGPCAEPTDEDQWLLARLDTTIRETRAGLDRFDFGAVGQSLYHFVWDDFCSWALELSKTRLTSDDDAVRRGALRVMGSVLADLLRLLHPIVPFVTEELWSFVTEPMNALDLWLDGKPQNELLILERYPTPRNDPQPELEARFAILQRFVIKVRQVRAGANVKDNARPVVLTKALSEHTRPMLEQAKGAVTFLARLDDIQFVDTKPKGVIAAYDEAFEIYLELAKYVDLDEYRGRIEKELAKATKDLESANNTLANPAFVDKAPADKVEATRARQAELESQVSKLSKDLEDFGALEAAKDGM